MNSGTWFVTTPTTGQLFFDGTQIVGLLGTTWLYSLGTNAIGSISLPTDWTIGLAVPVFIGSVFIPFENDRPFVTPPYIWTGPPLSAFVGSFNAGRFYIGGKEFADGTTLAGLPSAQNWRLIGTVMVDEVNLWEAYGSIVTDSTIPCHAEDAWRGFLARFDQSITIGTRTFYFADTPGNWNTTEFLTAREIKPREFHYVRLPNWYYKYDVAVHCIGTERIIGIDSPALYVGQQPWLTDLFVAVAGRKTHDVLGADYGFHLFTAERYSLFNGAITYPGWIRCAAILKNIGSVSLTVGPLASDGVSYQLFNFTAVALAFGSVFFGTGFPVMVIDKGIVFPRLRIDEYLATDIATRIVDAETGSVYYQSCFAKLKNFYYYPNTGTVNFKETVVQWVAEFLNQDSYYILLDENDSPITLHPVTNEVGEFELARARSYWRWPELFEPRFNSSDMTAEMILWYEPLDYVRGNGTFIFPLAEYPPQWQFQHGIKFQVRNILSDTCLSEGVRVIPMTVLNPHTFYRDWTIKNRTYVGLYWNRDGERLESPGTYSLPRYPLIDRNQDEQNLYNIKVPRSQLRWEVWQWAVPGNTFACKWGPYYGGSALAYTIIFGKTDGTYYWGTWNPVPELTLKEIYDGVLDPQVEKIHWKDLLIPMSRTLVIERMETSFGNRFAAHVRIERQVDPNAIALNFWDWQYFWNCFYDNMPRAATDTIPLKLVQMFPKQFPFTQSVLNDSLTTVLHQIWMDVHFLVITYQEEGTQYQIVELAYVFPGCPEGLVYHPGSHYYRYRGFDWQYYPLRYLLQMIDGRYMSYLYGHPPETVVYSDKSFYRDPNFAKLLFKGIISELPPTVHPAPSNFVSLGEVVNLGTLSEFGSYYDLTLCEPAEKLLVAKNDYYPAACLFGTFETIAVYKGNDTTVYSQFLEQVESYDPDLADQYRKASNPVYRAPSLMYVDVWRYDNPFNTKFPAKGEIVRIGERLLRTRVVDYPKPPLPVRTGYFGVANYEIVGSVTWRKHLAPDDYKLRRLIFPYRGWQRSLPIGIVLRMPSPMKSVIQTGRIDGLNEEVFNMRQIITTGNTLIAVYPRVAVINNAIEVRYFTQDGGKCPLWQGEPIIAVDAIPLTEGEVRIFIYTVRGVYSFSLAIDGVYDWRLEPIPAWFGRIIGR